MKTFVTGGSGFVGSHIIKALVEEGHEVVAYVRSPERLTAALSLHGDPPVEVVRGSLTDRGAVRDAMRRVDAVIHCAAVYSTDPRRSAEMQATNVEGTRCVLGAAVQTGCDPIVHVSSVTALYPMAGPVSAEGPDGPPLGTSPHPYSRSKRAADEIARALQAEGRPVVTTYPGGVFGARDPGPGEQLPLLSAALSAPFDLHGGAAIMADVRWVARAHAALLRPGQGPRRVLMGGRLVSWREYSDVLREITGRRLPRWIPVTRRMNAAVGALADALQRFVPLRLPISEEMAVFAFSASATDDSIAEALAGPKPPVSETLAEAIRWLTDRGHLPAALAGRLA